MVDVDILDKSFERIGVIDEYESFIWTERYNEAGDFELYTKMTSDIIDLVQLGNYVQIKNSDYMMVIETVSLDTDSENGDHITVKGRTIDSLLERRIVWGQSIYQNVGLGSLLKTLIYNNAINPSDTARKISNLVFYEPIDPAIEANTFDSIQLDGDNLYDVICSLCQAYKVGFKMTVNDQNQFVFRLFVGLDKSYAQDINPYIAFSPKLDNILSSNFITSDNGFKNVCLVMGEGEGSNRKTVEVKDDTATGLDRREMAIDESSLSTSTETGTMTTEEYLKQLTVKGNEALAENAYIESFDGQIDPTVFYTYGVDYNVGDIVQIVNEFKMESRARVSEYIRSYSTSGIDVYPTFTCE